MSRKRKETIGRVIYTALLVIFAVMLIAVSVIGLIDWRKYLIAYENSQPDAVVAEYVESLKSTEWKKQVSQAVDKMQHPFQSNDECDAIVNQMLGDTIQYKRGMGGTQDRYIYNVYCNGNPVGQFQIERDKSKVNKIDIGVIELFSHSDTFWFILDRASLCPWVVTGDSFDISDFTFTSSVSVTIPSNYSVQLNGKTVGTEYITESNIKYDILEPYYNEYPGLPTKVKYSVDNVFGSLQPIIYDQQGNTFTIDPDKDDSQFMESCSSDEIEALSEFAKAFVGPYARFTGTKNIWGNYGDLKQYVKDGSELHKRMDLFIEGGADYMNFYAVTVDGIQVNSVYSLGGGFYVINVSYSTTNYADYKTVNESNMKRIIACWDDSGIMAVSVE